MRLRSSAFALIGASLFAMAEPAEDTFMVNQGGTPIAKQFIPTLGAKDGLTFDYVRPMQSADGLPVEVRLEIAVDGGSSIANVFINPNPQLGTQKSQPGAFGTSLEEDAPSGPDIRGRIFIAKPEDLAAKIFNGTDYNQLPASKFTLSVRSGGAAPKTRSVRFALLNRQLGDGSTAPDWVKSKLFPPTPPDSGIGGGDPVTTTVPPSQSQTVTVQGSGFQPASTSTTSASALGASPNNILSTGAIAGIAVGAALGALLLGTALVWLLVRHRRQNKAGKAGLGYNGGPGRSGDLVAEKEANAIVAESPRSPYSEDGPHRDSTLIGGTSETAGDYQPYSDNPTATANAPPPGIAATVARAASANSRSTADRSSTAFPSSSAPAPPPAIGEEGLPPRADTGMSGRYAHLIEDNMTAEEIARLEEEERALDVAIEQARGVTTK